MLCTTFAFCQSKKAYARLEEGIKLNDQELINKALSKGVTLNDGLNEAIAQKSFDFVEYFVKKGADPSSGITKAVRENNVVYVKYLLEKGAKFVDEETTDLDGQSYCNGTPVKSMFIDGRNCWVYENNTKISNCENFTYKTKSILTGNRSIIFAIDNKNPEMIDLILKNGVDVQKPCEIYFFEGVVWRIQVTGNVIPTPPTIMLPIKYAIFKNADKSIIDVLIKYGAKP